MVLVQLLLLLEALGLVLVLVLEAHTVLAAQTLLELRHTTLGYTLTLTLELLGVEVQPTLTPLLQVP
jgi:hypothetical protein